MTATSVWCVQDSSIYVLATLYFWKISTHWIYFCSVGYCWQIISVVFLFWMPESPRFLISVGKFDEARKAFATIAKWNRKELVWDERLY